MTQPKENFNLSEKRMFTKKDGLFNKLRVHALDNHRVYREKDVKQFIQEILSDIEKIYISKEREMRIIDEVKEIIKAKAGEKLV